MEDNKKEENDGLKAKEKELQEKQPDPKQTDPEADGGLKNEDDSETPEQIAERLLRDGTKSDKKIKVNKKTYDDKNEKAKLYEAHAPLIEKILQNPELVENLLETKEKGSLDERVAAIEEERKEEKRREIRKVVTDALSNWQDFEQFWPEIQPVAESLVKQGLPYSDALRRAYFAVNPEAASLEKERIAKERANIEGIFPSTLGHSPKVSFKDKPKLNENEKRIAKALGKSEEEYAGLLDKHKDWLRTHGFETHLE